MSEPGVKSTQLAKPELRATSGDWHLFIAQNDKNILKQPPKVRKG